MWIIIAIIAALVALAIVIGVSVWGGDNQKPPDKSELPLSHTLQSDDWETLDKLWGLNPPKRHIRVDAGGFRLRKKVAFFGGSGNPTPTCVDYGGFVSLFVEDIQVKGGKGQLIQFLQGIGGC